ncbi:hypothetical protein AAIH70_25575 [Neorhizobium sp. BT27B]|uniref:hypothetical protein n=1 Tax=Neorhizobium sp. BT27B TaxID=3142625 RepID=UPI003D2D3D32
MTLDGLIQAYRPYLADETVPVRRSWEDTFKYAIKQYRGEAPLEEFDLDEWAAKLVADGVNPKFVDGYIRRWRDLLSRAETL